MDKASPPLDLAALDIFRTVAAEGSVTRAAERLQRVQSNVTTRVRQLEADLGTPLFLREGKRMALTPEGEVLRGYADRLLALAEEARQAVRPGQPTGRLRLGSMESTAASRLPAPLAQLHRLLQLSAQHGFRLVENNLYADMVAEPQPCLSSLDHLQQVVYVGSYSKSISPNVRVGYMLANPELIQKLLQLKMRSGLTTSQVMERVVYAAITDGRWRKHLKRLRQRLAEAQQEVSRRLNRLGFEIFVESDEGMYLWTRHPQIANSAALVDDALERGIMIGPGQLFMVDAQATGWMRFNVAFSTDPALWPHLEKLFARHAA